MNLIKIINLNYIKLSEIVNTGNKNNLVSVHPGALQQAQDKLREESQVSQAIRRFFVASLLRMTDDARVSGWTPTNGEVEHERVVKTGPDV
jgi:hypothetical protein